MSDEARFYLWMAIIGSACIAGIAACLFVPNCQ